MPGDVRDESLLKNIFETHKPAWVLHAAAHKHVALMEDGPIFWRRPPRPTMWSCAAHQRDGGFEAPGRDGVNACALGEGGEHKVSVKIKDFTVLEGSLPPRVMGELGAEQRPIAVLYLQCPRRRMAPCGAF
ncbi:MAG: polysaccharide biosynthesis protein [Elusimicrobiota bacterium]|nr:polysaccharide biosynthesis protein [Elusimicrobiota bacterium]